MSTELSPSEASARTTTSSCLMCKHTAGRQSDTFNALDGKQLKQFETKTFDPQQCIHTYNTADSLLTPHEITNTTHWRANDNKKGLVRGANTRPGTNMLNRIVNTRLFLLSCKVNIWDKGNEVLFIQYATGSSLGGWRFARVLRRTVALGANDTKRDDWMAPPST